MTDCRYWWGFSLLLFHHSWELAATIPTGSRVTIVTDAGFRCLWFYQVLELGWDFVGRVRGAVYFRLSNDEQWR